MKVRAIVLSAFVLTGLAAGLASATPITFMISTTGSGSFNGTAFGDNTLTITYATDTLNILAQPTGPSSADPSGTITVAISGVGIGTLNHSSFFFDDHATGVLGITDESSALDLLDESDAAFSTYTMKINLGPISNAIAGGTGVFTNEQTSNGLLTFTTNSSNASFQAVLATSVPEPDSLSLMLAGAVSLAAGLFRRRKR